MKREILQLHYFSGKTNEVWTVLGTSCTLSLVRAPFQESKRPRKRRFLSSSSPSPLPSLIVPSRRFWDWFKIIDTFPRDVSPSDIGIHVICDVIGLAVCIQSEASGCEKCVVKCFLKVLLSCLGSMAAPTIIVDSSSSCLKCEQLETSDHLQRHFHIILIKIGSADIG